MTPDGTFSVDPAVYEHMSLTKVGRDAQARWDESFSVWREQFPHMADDWDRAWRGELNDGWRDALPSFEAGEKIATRSAGQMVMEAFGEFAPTMVGGAADLVESTKTVFEGAGEFSKVHAGRNIPFGIREHAMGAIVNGLAAHGGMFEAQPDSYRRQVIPPTVPARLAIERGATLGWWKWVGDRGDVLGLDRFGASAPGTTVLKEFGFTADGIATRARVLLKRTRDA